MRSLSAGLLVLLAASTGAEGLGAQSLTRGWTIDLTGTASRLLYDYLSEDDWRPAVTVRVRHLIRNHLHVEIAYTRAATKEAFGCLPEYSCDKFQPAPIDVLTGGIGIQATLWEWDPFLGMTKGKLWQEGQDGRNYDAEAWGWYVGVDRPLRGRFRIGVEYRANRGHRWRGGHTWSHQVGLGLGVRF